MKKTTKKRWFTFLRKPQKKLCTYHDPGYCELYCVCKAMKKKNDET